MSGDALGYIIGGVALLSALPTVLTVGACAATAYGVGRVLVSVAKAGIKAERTFEHRTEHRLRSEAEEQNRRLQVELDHQAEALNSLHQSQLMKLDAAAKRLQAAEATGDTKVMETARKELKQLQQQISADLSKGRERICQESMQHMEQMLHEQTELQARAAEMLALHPKDDGAKDYAVSLLSTALDAFSRLKDMLSGEPDPMLAMQVNQLQNSLLHAQNQLDAGRYQLACIDATQVVTVSQRLAYQTAARRMVLESRRQWLTANIDAACAELEKARCVAVRSDDQCIQEDLDDFTNGRIERLSQQLSALQTEAARADAADINMLEMQLDETCKQMNCALEHGRRMLRAFYLRLSLMDKIKQWAGDNLYRLSWVSNEGDDVTRPLAAHFVHRVTGNEFTFVLGEEKADEQLETALSMFFANGQEMSEYEKASLRASLTAYLNREGIKNGMTCSGSVNGESQRQELRSMEAYQQRSKVSM